MCGVRGHPERADEMRTETRWRRKLQPFVVGCLAAIVVGHFVDNFFLALLLSSLAGAAVTLVLHVG